MEDKILFKYLEVNSCIYQKSMGLVIIETYRA